MKASILKPWPLITLIALPVAMLTSGYIAFLRTCTRVDISAKYGALEFEGSNGEYWAVNTWTPSDCVLYVSMPNVLPVAIDLLPEESLKGNFTRSQYRDETTYESMNAVLKYRNGRLVTMHFRGDDIRFSNREDGEYLKLPVKHARLVEVFGKPDSQQRSRRMKPLQTY